MAHYFSVLNQPTRKKSFLESWFSNLGITGWLIIINILIFILTISVAQFVEIENIFALQADNFFNNHYYWTLLTSMFMHAGPFHIFVNMFSLFFVGRFLEMLIGKKRFFWLYIISGIFASLFFVTLSYLFGNSALGASIFTKPDTFAVGASGAIFAIAGVLAFLTPKNKVYLIAGPLVAIIIQAVVDYFIESSTVSNILGFFITLYIFVSLISILSFNPSNKIALPVKMPFWLLPIIAIVPLIIIGLFIALPIGNMAHLGGFIAGAVYGIYLRLKYKKKTKMISEYFSR